MSYPDARYSPGWSVILAFPLFSVKDHCPHIVPEPFVRYKVADPDGTEPLLDVTSTLNVTSSVVERLDDELADTETLYVTDGWLTVTVAVFELILPFGHTT